MSHTMGRTGVCISELELKPLTKYGVDRYESNVNTLAQGVIFLLSLLVTTLLEGSMRKKDKRIILNNSGCINKKANKVKDDRLTQTSNTPTRILRSFS